MNFEDLLLKFFMWQIGNIVFLVLEAYWEAKGAGEEKEKMEKLYGLVRTTNFVLNKYRSPTSNQQLKADIDKIDKEIKDLDQKYKFDTKNLEEEGVKDFISDRFVGSTITSILNSITIIIFEIGDIFIGIITIAIVLLSWLYCTYKENLTDFLKEILSFVAISTVIGQTVYFGFMVSSTNTSFYLTLDGLIPFGIGFVFGMIILGTLTTIKEYLKNRKKSNILPSF